MELLRQYACLQRIPQRLGVCLTAQIRLAGPGLTAPGVSLDPPRRRAWRARRESPESEDQRGPADQALFGAQFAGAGVSPGLGPGDLRVKDGPSGRQGISGESPRRRIPQYPPIKRLKIPGACASRSSGGRL